MESNQLTLTDYYIPMTPQLRPLRKLILRTAMVSLVACLAWTASAQTKLRVHGAVVLKGLIDPNLAAITKDSGVTLELAGNGADNGLLDLVEGRADVAMLSASLEDVAGKINAKKPGAVDVSKLKSINLGTARILLVVHRGNSVKKLTNQQAIVDVLVKFTFGDAESLHLFVGPGRHGVPDGSFHRCQLRGV